MRIFINLLCFVFVGFRGDFVFPYKNISWVWKYTFGFRKYFFSLRSMLLAWGRFCLFVLGSIFWYKDLVLGMISNRKKLFAGLKKYFFLIKESISWI